MQTIRGQYVHGGFWKQDRYEHVIGQVVERKEGKNLGKE